jgi:hypothetical protein
MLAKLKAKKIVWDPSFDDPNSQVFIVSVDGMDFKVWEKSTQLYRLTRNNTPTSSIMGL